MLARWPLVAALLVVLDPLRAKGKELSSANWDRTVAGRQVFLKFFTPKCGHCTKMAPDFARLMEDYAESEFGVHEINCEGSGKSICADFYVESTPALKYGNATTGKINPRIFKDFPLDAKKPDGGRNYETMRRFAEKVLGPFCTPDDVEPCTAEERRLLEELPKRSKEDLAAEIASLTTRFHGRDKKWGKLKARFDDKNTDFGKVTKELKSEKAIFAKATDKFKQKTKPTPRETTKQEEKEKKMQDKFDAHEKKRLDMLEEREAIEQQRDDLDAEIKQSGLRLMKLVVRSLSDGKGKEDL